MSTFDGDAIVVPLLADEDVVRLRQVVRECLASVGFGIVDQTKMITAASELARNTVKYGGGGESRVEKVQNGTRKGLRLTFTDAGSGIPDIELALTDGYTTGNGMGLGLGGAKRLSDEFEIESAPGKGTTVRIAKWKPY
ncbi:MAG TPA: anti-sigma regulatory factor [Noviherbaspirillum sp.]|nr:anti-sigma regulatory factor [Noviherbaspirillum sp.]